MSNFEAYASGQAAVQLNADGSGFFYYPPVEGSADVAVAACVSKVNDYQYSYLIYDKPKGPADGASTRGGLPKAKLLASIDAACTGFAQSNIGPHPCTVPGVTCPNFVPAAGRMGICKRCDKMVGEHASGVKLVLSHQGAVWSDEVGIIKKRWLWDAKKQGAGTPPTEPIVFPLNANWTFEFRDRTNVRIAFTCESIRRELQCGLVVKRTDTYLDKVAGTCIGEFRGKKILNVTAPSLVERQEQLAKSVAATRSVAELKTAELADSFSLLSRTCSDFKLKTTSVFADPAWKTDALAKTLTEVPTFKRTATSAGSTLRSSQLLSTAGSSAFGSTIGGDDAPTEGYGTMSGVSRHKGKWLNELDVRKKLGDIHPVLKRSSQLKAASGRYSVDVPVQKRDTLFRKLRQVTGLDFDGFVAHTVKPGQIALVACLREDDPHCRRVLQVLESVNGTLAQQYPHSIQYAPEDDDTGTAPAAAASGGSDCPFWLVKFDMAESRFMVDKYNVQALPCFLAFSSGKLVYAGLMGGSGKVRIAACERPVNYLLLEPEPASQLVTERVLKAEGITWDLAGGVFDLAAGATTNVVPEALAHINRVAEYARKHGSPTDALTGLDTTPEVPDSYSCVLVNSKLPLTALNELTRVLLRNATMTSSTTGDANVKFPGSSAKLCGTSLVVAMHPSGVVMPRSQTCPVCTALSREGFGKSVVTVAQEAAESLPAVKEPWVCPRCSIIQNIPPERGAEFFLGDVSSVAAVKPLKPSTFAALTFLWKQLRSHAGHSTGILGLTDAIVMQRMQEFLDKGKRGEYLPASFRFGVAVPTEDVHIRGEKLTK